MTTIPVDHKNLPDILCRGFLEYPARTAMVFGQRSFSYADLYLKAVAVAARLERWGIKKGDRVGLLLDNSPDFVFCYFGILLAGAIVVPINHMFKREEARHILEDSASAALITSSAYDNMARELNVMIEPLRFIAWTNQGGQDEMSLDDVLSGSAPAPSSFKPGTVDLEDEAVFLYTSGTTGHPKAAVLTHGNLIANVRSSAQSIDVTPGDTFICFLPLFHSFAATACLLMPLFCGAKTVVMKSARPIRRLIRTVRRHRVTIFVGIPSVYQILAEIKLSKFLPGFLMSFFNPVRLAISGAAALPAVTFSKFEKKFRLPLLEGYGLTEASPVVSLNPLAGPRKPGSIGLPIPEVRVKIIDEQGRELGSGQEGELCVFGPNVMKGYHGKDDENKKVLKDGWLLTGDIAKTDPEGYLYIMGRKKEMVNVRGLNVYPREIEEVLYQNPHIKEAAIIGVPDAHRGEIPKGYVVLKEAGSITEHEIIAFLREHLALYKVPRKIEIRENLPKNTSGKILKRTLVEENAPGHPRP